LANAGALACSFDQGAMILAVSSFDFSVLLMLAVECRHEMAINKYAVSDAVSPQGSGPFRPLVFPGWRIHPAAHQ
jgi:hypothetical protein